MEVEHPLRFFPVLQPMAPLLKVRSYNEQGVAIEYDLKVVRQTCSAVRLSNITFQPDQKYTSHYTSSPHQRVIESQPTRSLQATDISCATSKEVAQRVHPALSCIHAALT